MTVTIRTDFSQLDSRHRNCLGHQLENDLNRFIDVHRSEQTGCTARDRFEECIVFSERFLSYLAIHQFLLHENIRLFKFGRALRYRLL